MNKNTSIDGLITGASGRDLFDFVECKEISMELNKDDLESLIHSIFDIGYRSPRDYYATYGYANGVDISTVMEITMCIKNEKMLQDSRMKELFLEYLI